MIGRIPQACDGNVTPLTVCNDVSRRDETKTIKPIINKAFVASSGDIITIYIFFFFFVINNYFYFFSHTTQHNIQNTTKQNNRHILNISRSNQKGGGEVGT